MVDGLFRRLFVFYIGLVLRRAYWLTRARFCGDAYLGFARVGALCWPYCNVVENFYDAGGASRFVGVVEDCGRSFGGVDALLYLPWVVLDAAGCRVVAVFCGVSSWVFRVRRFKTAVSRDSVVCTG